MAIHHSQIKKAEKAGYTLTEKDDHVVAFWPKRSLLIVGNSAADAMAQMQAAIAVCGGDEYRMVKDADAPRLVSAYNAEGQRLAGSPMPPVAVHGLIFGGKAEWQEDGGENDQAGVDLPFDDTAKSVTSSATSNASSSTIERINGVAVDGAVAFAEGTPAGDCPYSSETETTDETEGTEADEEYENFVRWNEEWDAAADEATDEEEGKGGTVVAAKYRAKYAEDGHPTHCGDWLAETLNDIVLNKEGTNIELFEQIADMNGVSLTKYKRDGVGWQGRLRMTGRNLMAKKVYQNEGKLVLPETLGGFKQAPAEWMATQRFKGKVAS